LARLRDHYADFTSRNVEIIAIGPDQIKPFQNYWSANNIPFIGIPDPKHKIALIYKQEVNLFKLGRMPLNCVVDTNGMIRFAHYGSSMADIPDNETFLNVIDKLSESSKSS